MKLCWLPFVFTSLLSAETGSLTIHMILHAIGQEHYQIARTPGSIRLNSQIDFTDRIFKRSTSATLRMKSDYTPLQLQLVTEERTDSVSVGNVTSTVTENGKSNTLPLPEHYFTIFGESPFAVQEMMLRYWVAHGKPAHLPMLRVSAAAEPIEISRTGQDSIVVSGKKVKLLRYTIANLAFGREVLWMNENGDLAAVMTFAGGLPMEAVRSEYETALPQLYHRGVAQEMADLKALAHEVPAEHTGSFAIAGATLVDGTGAAPVENATVIVRNGKITAVGPRPAVQIPRGTKIVEANGHTLLPGLWEMHIHASGVEYGPAMLAAGITTARDCGGELDYLVALRDLVDKGKVPSPRMLLAGLVDAGGLKAFGHITAETPEQGRAVVALYHRAGFQQIKLYTYLKPDVVTAISAEAHRLGMTVTGHVPQALNTFQGIEDGMDQINHLNYVSRMMHLPDDAHGPVDVNSAASQKAIEFLRAHHTVVDPTAGWGEMAGHSKEIDVASFEPGILHVPFVVETKYRGLGGVTTASQMKERSAENLAVIAALHRAGIPIVPGSDTGLPGYGLLREIELYVKAGLTPLEAIQSATIVSARAMNLDHDSGTVQVGKRADLILVDGNPLARISDLRKVSHVVTAGRMYQTARLWQSVGFRP